jgi:hypothetical protein
MSLPEGDRPEFVAQVFLDPNELARRGVEVPLDVLIQTSAFGDRRPTLFAVKKFLPEKYQAAWENVNLTFGTYDEAAVLNTPEASWRPPLPVQLQNALIARGIDLECAPVELGVNADVFARPASRAENAEVSPQGRK